MTEIMCWICDHIRQNKVRNKNIRMYLDSTDNKKVCEKIYIEKRPLNYVVNELCPIERNQILLKNIFKLTI